MYDRANPRAITMLTLLVMIIVLGILMIGWLVYYERTVRRLSRDLAAAADRVARLEQLVKPMSENEVERRVNRRVMSEVVSKS